MTYRSMARQIGRSHITPKTVPSLVSITESFFKVLGLINKLDLVEHEDTDPVVRLWVKDLTPHMSTYLKEVSKSRKPPRVRARKPKR